jgi:hypothetical protein
MKSAYSYDQYHWCPITFIVIIGVTTSSNIYNNLKLGKAIAIKIKAGVIVQINSIKVP